MGHLITAKIVGCGVDCFSIGFGKPLFSKLIGGTKYQITPWLFGGYCALEDETDSSNSPTAFSNLRYRSKVIMITAGCAVNIITGLIALALNHFYFDNYTLYLFGHLSLLLGITNLIPFPALDGSYPFLVLLEKKMGKEEGYKLMGKIVRVGFNILMILNVISIIFLFWLFRYEILLSFINILLYILNISMTIYRYI
jgi:membrane-associated protease RseP (regulator of RpoE activity)